MMQSFICGSLTNLKPCIGLECSMLIKLHGNSLIGLYWSDEI